jgi:hypothetical protein
MQLFIRKLVQYLLIPLAILALYYRPALAQEVKETGRQPGYNLAEQYEIAASELKSWFVGSRPIKSELKKEKEIDPELGLYLDNVSFQNVYELNYPANYGVLVNGTRPDRTEIGLQRGDIIFEIDGIPVKHLSHLEDMLADKAIGDSISVKYFRGGETYQKVLLIPAKEESERYSSVFDQKAMLKSPGLGGGSYQPLYVNTDLSGISNLAKELGLKALSPLNSLYHGFAFQGLVGDGYFIGGLGGWTGSSQQSNYTVGTNTQVERNLRYHSGLGGVTLDKRLRVGDRWLLSYGLMLGGGGTKLEIYQTEQDVAWSEIDSTSSYNSYLQLKKNYLLLQPRVSLTYRVLPVFWIKIEAGYMLSYSKSGWRNILIDNKYDVTGPDKEVALNGFTISISPWFGF